MHPNSQTNGHSNGYSNGHSNGHSNGYSNGHTELAREPLKYSGALDQFKSFEVTPCIGREYVDVNVVELMKAPNSDELLRDLAITISRRGAVFFRAQNDLTDELQKELIQRLGLLAGKPKQNTLHIHPLGNYNLDKKGHINIITTDKEATPAEDLFKNQAERPLGVRGAWHTDIGYEPCPADYTCLRVTKLPETGGDTMWASSCEIYDKISPAYRKLLESLTATFGQLRYPKTAQEKGFDLVFEERGAPENVGTKLQTNHPVVRTNPVTGWKSLYGVGNHIVRYNELTPEEGKRLHDYLLQMIVENIDVQLRHKWNNINDIAIWDNRSVFHAANMDFAGLGARTGHRVVGIGERPYFDPASKTRREALAAEQRVI